MRERADLAGGSIQIETSPGTGTTIYVTVPITAKEHSKGKNGK